MKRQLSQTQEIYRSVKPKLARQNATVSPMVLYKAPRQRSLANPPFKGVSPEAKNRDTAGSIGVLQGTNWSELDLLNPITSGATASDRIGRNVQLKSVLFRWNFSTNNQYATRIVLIYDREPNLVLPDVSEIYASTGGTGFNTPLNLANGNRFVILHDEIVNPQWAGGNTAGKVYRKLNLPMKFTNTSSTDISTITEGAIYAACAIPISPSVSTIGIGYVSRVRYTDV